MSSAYSHLGQTGICQLAAGCEIQLLQGLKHEQGGASWVRIRLLRVWGLIFYLLV